MKVMESILFTLCLCACIFLIGKHWGEDNMILVFFSSTTGVIAFLGIAMDNMVRRNKNIVVEGYFIYIIAYAIILGYFLYLTTGQLPPKHLLWISSLVGFWAFPFGANIFKNIFLPKEE